MISRLQARLDLQLLLANGETARITQIAPAEATWTRNMPAVADLLDTTCSSSYLPLDLKAIAGGRVLFWLFEHQQPERCKPGDPGFFFGIVDDLSRDKLGRHITLTCRDMTSVLLDTTVTAKELKSVQLQHALTLEQVVKQLVGFGGPFAQDWRVRSLSATGSKVVYTALSQVSSLKRVKGKGAKKTPARATQKRVSLDLFMEGDDTSVWEVIVQLCARMAVVPEIMLASDGTPEVVLIDALDLQTSDVLRPFERGGRRFRTLTLGRSVGVVTESIQFASEKDIPDQIVVGAWDHEKGTMIEVAFPKDAKPKKGDKLRRVYQVAEGSADVTVLERVAAAAWAESRQRQLEIEVETWSPWSDGGSANDADLLAAGPGGAMAILLDDRFEHQLAGEVGDVFEGVPADVLAAFERAEQTRTPSVLFQMGELVHTYSGGEGPEYSCKVKLNAWLGKQPEAA